MKIIKEKDQTYPFDYAFEFEFDWDIVDFCRYLKNKYSIKCFSFVNNKWRTNSIEPLLDIKEKFPEVKVEEGIVLEKKIPELNIEGIKGELRDYQKEAVHFLDRCNGRGLLAFDCGTGKTLISLSYIVKNKFKKSLIVCPASVKESWKGEVLKFTNLKPLVIGSTDKKIDFKNHDIFIINFDIVHKFVELFKRLNFDIIVIDESTYIKSPRARRTKAVQAISRRIRHVIPMSGTPILSKTCDLFTSLNIIDERTWNNAWSFYKKFCNLKHTYWGVDYSGSSNIEELKERISPYFMRKTRKEVLSQLPPRNYIFTPTSLEKDQRIRYNKAIRSLPDYLREYKLRTEEEIEKAMGAEKLVLLNELRAITTESKVEITKEITNNLISEGEKVIIFCNYNTELEFLKDYFKEQAVMITGKVDVKDRGEIVKEFQNNNDVKVFLAGMNSANTGITLTSSNNVIFMSYDWNPSNMEQAISRIDRIGQEASQINIYTIYAEETLDDYVIELLRKKQNLIDKLIEGKETENMVNSVYKKIKKNI